MPDLDLGKKEFVRVGTGEVATFEEITARSERKRRRKHVRRQRNR